MKSKLYSFTMLAAALAISKFSAGQTMIQNWLAQSNNAAITNSDDRPYFTHVDASGMIGMIGVSNSKVILATYDANGNDLWTNKYTSYSSDYPLGLEKSAAGNYYIGYFWGGTIRKVGPNGGSAWTTGSSAYHGQDFVVDQNGDVYVVGTDYPQTTIYIDKILSNGTKIWTKTYTGYYGFGGEPKHLKMDNNGNLLIALAAKNSVGDRYVSVAKFDTVGANSTQVWHNAYTAIKGEVADFILDNNTNASYVCGTLDNGTDYDMVVYKSGPSGAVNWGVTFHDGSVNGSDYAQSLAQDAAGNIYVALSSQGTGRKYTVRKYTSAGALVTSASVNASGFPSYYNKVKVLIHPGNNSLYLACTDEFASSDQQMVLYKSALNLASLTQVYTYNHASQGDDYSVDLDIDPTGSQLIFTGNAYTTLNGNDYYYSKVDTTGAFVFNNVYNGVINGNDYANSLVTDASNQPLAAGATLSTLTGLDGYMVKYDASGNEIWQAVFAGTGSFDDYLNAVDINTSGHYYAGGFTETSPNNNDMWLLKVDGNGTKLWDVALSGSQAGGADEVRDVYTDNFNNGYAAGYQTNVGTGQDATIIKFNSSGSVLWNKKYTGAGSMKDAFFDIGSKTGNPVYAVGYTTKANGESDMLIVKYDAAGNLQWSRTYNSAQNGNDTALAVNVDANNNIAVVGRSDSAKAIVARYDASGNLQWAASDPNMNEVGPDVATLASGKTFIVCHKDSGLVYKNRIMCFDNTGTLVWYRDYNYSCCEHPMKLAKTASGNLLVAIDYYGYIGVIELDTLGNEKNNVLTYLNIFGNAEYGGTRDIKLDNNGDVYVTGYFAQETGADVYMQKICYTPSPVSISGAQAVCAQSQANIYTVPTNSTITNHAWMGTNGLSVSTGSLTSIAMVNAGTSSGYLVLQQSNYCGGSDPDSLYITVNPLPAVSAGADMLICPGSAVTLSGSGAQNYAWSGGVTDGLAFAPVMTQAYQVTGTDTNGCSNADTVIVALKQPPVVGLCMVTVDTFSTHNILAWEKAGLTNEIAYFNIYREDITNNYTLIGSVSFDSLSEYHDYDTTLADPNVTTKRYKISAVDTCGNEGPKSGFHNTIFISDNNGTFTWNTYTIQNMPNPVNNYALYRDDLSNGNWTLVGMTAGTQNVLNDPQYATYQTTGSWRVETIWNITCTPTVRQGANGVLGAIVKSKSNITNNKVVGVQSYGDSNFSLYPNPTSGKLSINLLSAGKATVRIVSMLGQQIFAEQVSGASGLTIDLSAFESGTYMVQVITEKSTTLKKIVKE
jgi:hypothetical protein